MNTEIKTSVGRLVGHWPYEEATKMAVAVNGQVTECKPLMIPGIVMQLWPKLPALFDLEKQPV